MKHVTACTFDCPDACSLLAEPDGDGGVRLRGNPDSPFTRGLMCAKTRRHARRLQSPSRILAPLRKTRGGFRTIGWEEALDLAAEKIQSLRREPTALVHIHSDGAKGVLKEAVNLFFSQLGSSRIRGSLCDAAGYIAGVEDCGSRENNDIDDLENTAAVVNWGRDLSRSSIHIAAAVAAARRRGARVLSISPGGDGNDAFSDERIRIRPGHRPFPGRRRYQAAARRGPVVRCGGGPGPAPGKIFRPHPRPLDRGAALHLRSGGGGPRAPLPLVRARKTPGDPDRRRAAALPVRRGERALHQRPGLSQRQRRHPRRRGLFSPALLPQPRARVAERARAQGPARLSHRRHRPGAPRRRKPAGAHGLGQRGQCGQPGPGFPGDRPGLRANRFQGGGGRLHERHRRAGGPHPALCPDARAGGHRRLLPARVRAARERGVPAARRGAHGPVDRERSGPAARPAGGHAAGRGLPRRRPEDPLARHEPGGAARAAFRALKKAEGGLRRAQFRPPRRKIPVPGRPARRAAGPGALSPAAADAGAARRHPLPNPARGPGRPAPGVGLPGEPVPGRPRPRPARGAGVPARAHGGLGRADARPSPGDGQFIAAAIG